MEKALVPIESGRLAPRDIEGLWRVGQMLLGSGLLPQGVRTPEAAAVLVNAAMELGIPFTAAITGISIVNGRPLLHSKLPLALAIKTGQFRGMEERWEGLGPDGSVTDRSVCTVTVRRQVGDQVLSFSGSFGVADAKRAGLAGKGTHALYPKDMLFHRAKSRAIERAFPDALCGLGVVQPEDEERVFAPRRVTNEALQPAASTSAIDAIDLAETSPGAAGEPGSTAPGPAAPSPKRPVFDAAGNLIEDDDKAAALAAEMGKLI
jgi:hypothetical protein